MFALDWKAHVDRGIVDFPVAEGDFVRRQRGAYVRVVGDHLVASVNETLVPYLPEQPPDRLYVGVVESVVGIGHVHPKTHALGHPLPIVDVELYRLAAPARELRHANLAFDLALVEYPEFLLDFVLDRQAVGVPTGLARAVIAPHVLEARKDVLERAREDMVDAGLAVGGRRALVPDIQRPILALLLGGVEHVMLAPQREYLPFELRAVIAARHVLESHRPLFSEPQTKTPRQWMLRIVADSSGIYSRGEGSADLRGPTSRYHPVSHAPRDASLKRSQYLIGAMTRPVYGGPPAEPTEMRHIRSVGGSGVIFVGGAARSFHHPPLASGPLQSDYSSPSLPLRLPAPLHLAGRVPSAGTGNQGRS